MSRTEKNESMQDQMQDLKKDVVREVKQSTKKRHPFFSCVLIVFVLVFVGLVWLSWNVAATGLANIPILSLWAYRVPEPIRLIQSGVPVEKIIASQLQSGLSNQLFSIQLTESSLTASLQKLLNQSSVGFISASGSQVAIRPGQILELFLPLKLSKKATAIRAGLFVHYQNGNISVSIKNVFLGTMHIPDSMIAVFFQAYLDKQIKIFYQSFESFLKLNQLTTEEGKIVVSGVMNVQTNK